jgi:hypothetical protein
MALPPPTPPAKVVAAPIRIQTGDFARVATVA